MFKPKEFLDWDTYKRRVEMVNLIAWQQQIRRRSLA
jgi:hypothetical protein